MNRITFLHRRTFMSLVLLTLASVMAACAGVPGNANRGAGNARTVPNIPTVTTTSPGRPPLTSWYLPTPAPDQVTAGAPRQGVVKGNVRLDVISVFIRDDQVTMLLGTKAVAPQKPLKPRQVALRNAKDAPLSQGQPVAVATIDGLSLSVLTLNLKDYASPLLHLKVSGLDPSQADDAGTAVPFDATIPLLVNPHPSDKPFLYAGAHWVYPVGEDLTYSDGMQVLLGDGTQVPPTMMAGPQYTGGVAEYLAFTVRTAAGQAEKVYLLTMADGSVKRVTRDAYVAALDPVLNPPPPPTDGPHTGPDAHETPGVPPAQPTVEPNLQDLLQQYSADATRRSQPSK